MAVARTREYRAWWKARSRAHMAPQWSSSFATFLADMGPCPDGFELQRLRLERGYVPRNCRWALRSERPGRLYGQRYGRALTDPAGDT